MEGTHGSSSAAAADSAMVHARPTVADLHGENHFAQVARKNWLAAKKSPKVRPDVVKKELWDELENVDFAYSSLLVLENLQLLERYLWPGFTEDASNYHHLLLALMVNVKRRENLPSWGTLRCTAPHCHSSKTANTLQTTSPASLQSSPRSFAASCP
jgi:intron-binding protein aquarius